VTIVRGQEFAFFQRSVPPELRRSVRLSFRVTPDERRQIQARMKAAGITVEADWLRLVALGRRRAT
jgi:hypothetical protein